MKIVSINALPPQLAYVERGLAPVLLAQPTYLWGVSAVDAIVDKLLLGKPVPARIPLDLARVSVNNLGALRDKRYHAASVLKYMSGIMEAVTKSTHGYFKSVPVVSGLFPLLAIAILPSEVSYLAALAANHLALNQQGLTTA